ncbi:hypothetical protein GJ700_02465 [Duganella sp. FT92W]|uniref:Conjugal transfer protein TraN n=2 Tax=Pseudoduganella rivuli TaxID=2666085 RepID=A0A7X2IJA3_9BURK|nr:conjugal transfer protein TraN [Pseudoduganella rivuli]MRV70582.1 hypothetical protein [Pseudoduganella rivuli]
MEAGRQANRFASGKVNGSDAATVVPGYTATPPERVYYGKPDLRSDSNARLTLCALLPSDPTCAAQTSAIAAAAAPRPGIPGTDPSISAASAIAKNPFGTVSTLADYYSGCSSSGACSSSVFCLGSKCFDTTRPDDPDFAQAMTYMEAVREAGIYLDPATMRVFTGEDNRCRNRLLKNCCTTNSAGAGYANQSVFGFGSKLVFDILMNSRNRQFVTQGLQAMFTGAGFSGTFTSYGVTIAVNGTAVPAGSITIASSGNMVIAVDPYSLVIAIIIYVVLSALSCNAGEGKLAMKEGASLCHTVGTWCSSCIRVLGSCVSCIEHTTSKCCFNSRLARMINEQGRQQLGLDWGPPKNPQCDGFTVAQLQSLDFARMDLTEFYASIVPTLPNVSAIQAANAERAATCYYGRGKC